MRSRNLMLFTVSLIVLTSIVVYSADAAGIPKKAISTVARFLESDLPTTTLFTDVSHTITATQQFTTTSAVFQNPAQTFGTTLAGGTVSANRTLNLPAITGTDTLGALGMTQVWTGTQTINSLTLGGDMNVGSNGLTTSGHKGTLPANTGTFLYTNSSGSSLTNIVTSITGTANNLTSSASTGAVTLNLGSNVVTTGGSGQTITKTLTLTSPQVNGLSINFTKITASPRTLDYHADTVVIDATSANPTIINLPTASGHQGKTYTFQKNDTSGNTVMIVPFGTQKINGALNLNLTSNLGSAVLQSDGSNWERTDRTADEANSFRTQGTTINRWYGSATSALASSTIISTANQLRAYPFVVPKAITMDRIQTEISTAGSPTSGQFCRMGIYTEDGNTYPYHLVSGSDVATFVGSSGVKTNTFTSPITLRAGLYFLAHDCESFTTTQPTFRGVPVGAVPSVLGYVSTMGANGVGTAWQVAFTETGGTALPSIYPTGGTVQNNLIQAMILVRIVG